MGGSVPDRRERSGDQTCSEPLDLLACVCAITLCVCREISRKQEVEAGVEDKKDASAACKEMRSTLDRRTGESATASEEELPERRWEERAVWASSTWARTDRSPD